MSHFYDLYLSNSDTNANIPCTFIKIKQGFDTSIYGEEKQKKACKRVIEIYEEFSVTYFGFSCSLKH